jgi:hypothetical protein
VFAGVSVSALAQQGADLQTQIRQAFETLLANPTDIRLIYRYAQLQIQAGNYEAAAGALEQMSILAPDQPRVKFELGALYMRMNAPQTALPYLREALASPNLPDDVRQQAQIYLAEAERRGRRSQLSGDITLGMRWDSNANLVPAGNSVFSRGVVVQGTEAPQSDFAGLFVGRATHVFDFNTNDDTSLVSTFYGYGTRQINVTLSNVLLGEFTSGVRFHPFPNLYPRATMRPHFVTNAVSLDSTFYSWTFGGGFDLTLPLSDSNAIDFTYEYRDVNYRNIASRPTAADLTGFENQMRARFTHVIRGNWSSWLELSGRVVQTRQEFLNFNELGVTVGTSFEYAIADWRPWFASGYAIYYYRPYAAPDPSVDPTTKRLENEVRFGGANIIPIVGAFSLVQQVDYLRTYANLPNYARHNWSLTMGGVWRF